jgi:flavin-dependent dehydrogenase
MEPLTMQERMTARDAPAVNGAVDVAVIGGGPGGCAAAISCAQAGLRVALVERDPFPRDHPGETLHPGVEPLLARLGVANQVLAAGFIRHEGHWVEWNAPRRFESFGEDQQGAWRGFQAWRADFDGILLQRAREVGVTIFQPCRAIRPVVNSDCVAGVATSEGTLPSSFVVDASGSRHWLARCLGLKVERRSPRLIARYGYARGECPLHDEAPSIVADDKGWTWKARVRPRLYVWTRLALHDEDIAADWLPDEFHGLQSHGKPRGADVTWRKVTPTASPGYFLVGDAASVLDPASSHGVLKAIMSGMMAAHAIVQIARHQLNAAQVAHAYSHWMHDWFEHDERRLRDLCRSAEGAKHYVG